MCTNDRIKNPNSNKIAAFVTEFMVSKELKSDCVLDNVSKCCKCGKNEAKGKTNQCDSCLLDGII